jgi:hypothetical protein
VNLRAAQVDSQIKLSLESLSRQGLSLFQGPVRTDGAAIDWFS